MPSKKIKAKKSIYLLALIISVIIFAAGSGIYYFYNNYHSAAKNSSQEVSRVVAAVGKLMELPAGETPFLATVMSKDDLQSQAFFKNAEKGDKLLVYAKAMKAILYRPKVNKVIEVEPIVLNDSKPEVSKQSLKIVYYNGTADANIIAGVATAIQNKFGALTAPISGAEAANKDYQDTLVIDLTGANGTSTQVIANFIGGKVASLPVGEIKPAADVLIILGKNIESAAEANPQKSLKVFYYNGTITAGITAGVEEKVQAKFGALIETAGQDKAASRTYEGISVIDLTGTNSTSTQVIADFLGGKVASLPAGEVKPEADVLVILGK
jgi:predicted alpha/beta-hydrolase family hydrolase